MARLSVILDGQAPMVFNTKDFNPNGDGSDIRAFLDTASQSFRHQDYYLDSLSDIVLRGLRSLADLEGFTDISVTVDSV